MGNQLVSITPSQIFPVEHYLRDHNELKFDASLGSTRFLKVARAHSQEGLIVIKVFAIHDPTLPLAPYKERLEDIRTKLASAVNCLPFQKIVITEKAGLIMREYVKYSLYDRISTRPFLTTIEKKWITFQVLYALYQCHKVGVCHGDIKLENITITSWNWVLLVDFASFKPTFLPEDNPADYSYFFDTSRRRTCYIAPERFVKGNTNDNNPIFYENTCNNAELTPAMDIFSAGCALLELWNELHHAPFDLSQLLTFRTSDYTTPPTPVKQHLDHIHDPVLRNLLASMIQRNPRYRKSAELYLSEERGKLFPEYFYSFLQSYMLMFSAPNPILSPDEKVVRLKKDIGSVFKLLGGRMDKEVSEKAKDDKGVEDGVEKESKNVLVEGEDKEQIEVGKELKEEEGKFSIGSEGNIIDVNIKSEFKEEMASSSLQTNCEIKKNDEPKENTKESEDKQVAETSSANCDNDGLVIIVSLVTSCIRGLHDSNSKIKSLEILYELATHANEETILDRILPYLLYLAKDYLPRVRISALATVTSCLQLIHRIPRSDVNVFPEYVLPGLQHLSMDPSTSVRAAYARNVATLAEVAVIFLDQTQVQHPKQQVEKDWKSGEDDWDEQSIGSDDMDDEGAMAVGGGGGGKDGGGTDEMKLAKVIPIYKKGEYKDCANYKPILLLPVFSKVFEALILSQIQKYFSTHNLLTPEQYRFRPKRSTSDAIQNIITNACSAIESNCISQMYDLTKAFGMMSHPILLNKLRHCGIRGLPLMLFRSYTNKTGKNAAALRLNYDNELQTLHEMFQQTIIPLLTDSPSIVKQTLMDSGITKLCVFFGKQKANDLLLSHIITFLNDKEDKELRGTFFECIVGVAAYIGWHCSSILTPLLLQGLSDSCEFVATKAIRAMSALTELGLLNKPALCELIVETSGFLVHPNLWIRHAVAGFVSSASKAMTLLDVQCKIMPNLEPYMKYSLIQIEKPELLLESLYDPIPRPVFDMVIKEQEINILIDTMMSRKISRDLIARGQVPPSDLALDMHQNLKNLFRRLDANGMNATVEAYILRLSSQLIKIHKQKLKPIKLSDGRIELNSLKTTVRSHVYHLGDARTKQDVLTQKQSESTSSGGPPSSSRSTSSRPSSPTLEPHVVLPFVITNNEPANNMSLHERSYIQYRTAKCRVDLWSLIGRQQDHYLEAQRSREWAEQAVWQPQLPPPGWRVRGALVAHLHEHRGPVTRLVPLAPHSSAMFASASRDGCVRLWDTARMEGKSIANRSKMYYRFPDGGNIIAMAVCEEGKSLAVASHTGDIHVLQVDIPSSRLYPIQTRSLPESDGCVVDLQYLDSGPHSVLIYATLYGSLVGWDLRSPVEAWRLENGLKPGVITTFCVDSHHSWLTLGTNRGKHAVWDLRFRLKSATFAHPHKYRIHKVVSHPTEHNLILSSVANNHNEISVWNLETSLRQKVLWGSKSPPLSKPKVVSHSVCAMQAGCIDRSGFLLAGGTDQMVRFWDLESPTESYLAVPAPGDTQPLPQVSYKSRPIDGIKVIYEVSDPPISSRMAGKGDEQPRPGPEPPAAGHRDCITDICLVKASQCFLVSASRDGVIKVWK